MISYDFASFANTEQRKISGLLVMFERRRKGIRRGLSFFHHFSSKPLEKMMISVLIADDHSLVRNVLWRLLERAGDIQIVAIASDGQEAVQQAVLHCPNVAVMDVSMPLLNGIEATKQICTCCPETRVLMLSMHDTPDYVHLGIQAGASGYVLKDGACNDLVTAVRTVFQGNRYFSQQIAEVARHYIE